MEGPFYPQWSLGELMSDTKHIRLKVQALVFDAA